jgi:hypothetical protein
MPFTKQSNPHAAKEAKHAGAVAKHSKKVGAHPAAAKAVQKQAMSA